LGKSGCVEHQTKGKCIGGGVDLICAADIRFCSSDAAFSIQE
jgi:2,4-dienoyl-CoA reductase (NADPH2)